MVSIHERAEHKTYIDFASTSRQIIIAALLAIIIGLAVTTQVDEVPDAAVAILAIPGNLWLRALRAVGTLSS